MTPILELTPSRKIRIWPDYSILPIEIELPRRRRVAVFLMAVICIIASGLFMLYMMLTPMVLTQSNLAFLISFAVTLAVLLLGWRAMRQYVIRDKLTISREGVEVIFRGIVCDSRLHWPLDACKGLRRREVRLNGKDGAEVRYMSLKSCMKPVKPPLLLSNAVYMG